MATAREQRRAQRAQDFANQNIKKAKNFNFDQHNRKDVTDGTHVSGQEVKHLNKTFGRKKAYKAMQAQKDAGATFGKYAENKFNRMGARIEARQKAKAARGSTGQETNAIDDAQTGAGDSVTNNGNMAVGQDNIAGNNNTRVEGNDNIVGDNNTRVEGNDNQVGNNNTRIESGRDTNIGANSGSHSAGDNNSGIVGNNNAMAENNANNSIEKNVTQDNDMEANFTGSNNTVIQNADNSVTTYQGDNRSFIYNSTGGAQGQMYDTPGSMATLGGFYDANDSPAAQAGFVDMYSRANAKNQTRYAGDAMETFAKYGNLDARGYTNESMDTTLGRSIQNSQDRADTQTGLVFGDIWNDNYITESWKMGSPPEEIKSNAGELADEAKDDIEDM